MTGLDAAGPAPVDVRVRCARQLHTLRWAGGALIAADHPDPERERALIALGGEPSRCLELLDLWREHAADPAVLVLAARGGTDELPVDPPEPEADEDTAVPASVGANQVVYHGAYRPMRRSSFGWVSGRHHHHHGPGGRRPGVGALLTLDRRLADRLVHSVVTTWAQRIAEDDPRVPDARPALRAALHGRVVRAVRGWLGDPTRSVEVRLLDPGAAPYLAVADSGAVDVGLALDWLSEVWLPGLAVTFGRFCLGATAQSPTSWTLRTVDRDLHDVRTMQVSW